MKHYAVIGLMSGTSLDGLDVAACIYQHDENKWTFEVLEAQTYKYDDAWTSRLQNADQLSGLDLAMLNVELGALHGEWVKEFIDNSGFKADFISSHGHTVFHQPERSLTLQIGSPAHIAATTRLPVVADFRTKDVALGGQGAPLVPIGDRLLFGDYDFCLNLGGIANISYEMMNERLAFDICPANMALNMLAKQAGKTYDEGGQMAASGRLIPSLLDAFNALEYYQADPPKSLGKEFFDGQFFPIILSAMKQNIPLADILHTCTEHIAIQISSVLDGWSGKLLCTGGGTWNDFLVERIKAHTSLEVIVPEERIINFKEAIIFGFLGVLCWRGEVNTLSSVTGAMQDSVGGVIVGG